MRHALSRLLVLALSAIAADAAVAQDASRGRNHYKWYDVGGALHYTDALPPEAARLGYDIVSPQGVVYVGPPVFFNFGFRSGGGHHGGGRGFGGGRGGHGGGHR